MDSLIRKTEMLIDKAMKMWDMKEFRPETIDPVVRLLIACVADESTRLEHLIDQASSNINQHLIDTLLPNQMALGAPAHGMIQAKPVEPHLDLHPGVAFIYEKPGNVKKRKQKQQITFCPALPMHLLRAELKYIYSARGLKSLSDHKDVIIPGKPSERNSLWIGLDIDDAISTLDGLGLYLVKRNNWKLSEDQHAQTGVPGIISIKHGNVELELEKGFDMDYLLQQPSGSSFSYNKQELLTYHDWVKPALYTYDRSFFRVTSQDHKSVHVVKTDFPSFFNDLFDKEDLEPLEKQQLVWLELAINPSDTKMVNDLEVYINAVPVVNIQNRVVNLSSEEPVKNLPLAHEEQFMGISKHCSFNVFHNPITDHDQGDRPYILRSVNMERNSGKTYSKRLEGIIEEMETNFAILYEYFSLDDDEVETLREALQPLKLSLLKLSEPDQDGHKHYLIFNKENTPDVASVDVHYMYSNGLQANEILENEKVMTDNTLIDAKSLRFISKTRGGSPPLNQEEKKRAMDFLFLSQNKLLTREDILRYCHFYLGSKLIHAEVSQGTLSLRQGLRNCLIVKLNLDGKKCDYQEGEQISRELEQKFYQESASVIPVKVQTSIH